MALKDISTKKYMRNPRIFADFFNGFIYGGKQIIDGDTLEEIDTSMLSIIPSLNGKKSKAYQKYRDIIKKAVIMKGNSCFYALLGIENQTDIHYAMPVRDMLYDSLTYLKQVDEISSRNRDEGRYDSDTFLSGVGKEDKLLPVITVTIYWGTKSWDGPTTLKEMLLPVDPDVERYINDYSINLFSIIDVMEFPEYHTDLRELFLFLNTRNDDVKMRQLVESDERFLHINRETAELMRDFASIKLPRANKEGEYNMCKAVLDIEKKGIEKGVLETLISLVQDGMLDIAEAAKRAGITVEEMQKKINAIDK